MSQLQATIRGEDKSVCAYPVRPVRTQSKLPSLETGIDILFAEMIEATAVASFLVAQAKLPYIRITIRKMDVMKILLMILCEIKSLENKKKTLQK
ncbi:MAG: hypothetical protein ACSLEX_00155 [Minisyncoccota bacterium]